MYLAGGGQRVQAAGDVIGPHKRRQLQHAVVQAGAARPVVLHHPLQQQLAGSS